MFFGALDSWWKKLNWKSEKEKKSEHQIRERERRLPGKRQVSSFFIDNLCPRLPLTETVRCPLALALSPSNNLSIYRTHTHKTLYLSREQSLKKSQALKPSLNHSRLLFQKNLGQPKFAEFSLFFIFVNFQNFIW